MMKTKIIERILKETQTPDLFEILSRRLSLSDLQSLLLEVYRVRTKNLTPKHLLQQYEQNRLVQPSQISPLKLLEFDRLAYSLLPPGFDILELSPVCPLGTNSVVATVDQNNTLTTIRNSEVCSDSTNVLALECAHRRKTLYRETTQPEEEIKLCASHRLLRPQAPNLPAVFPHFRIFSLCTAGRDQGSYRFEMAALTEHLDYYIRLCQAARQAGFKLDAIRIALTAFDKTRSDLLKTQLVDPLSQQYPEVTFTFDQERESGRGYYIGAGFHIYLTDTTGQDYFIVDGGFTTWTQQLLSNRKERLFISGLGSERFVFCFGE